MYSLRKVKTFIGNEGRGFNAELLRDGRPVAFVIDSAQGGEFEYQWYGGGKTLGKKHLAEMFKLQKFVETLPDLDGGHGMLRMDMDRYVGSLLDAYLEDRQKRNWCKTNCVFRLKGDTEGEYRTIPVPRNNPELMVKCIAHVKEMYGDRVEEILNERFK
ncbi:MAG: hypothetical protein WCP55_13810 [Lentisphaerota bacterium]